VWDVTQKNPTLAHKLVGHTKAVTSVDWRVRLSLEELNANKK